MASQSPWRSATANICPVTALSPQSFAQVVPGPGRNGSSTSGAASLGDVWRSTKFAGWAGNVSPPPSQSRIIGWLRANVGAIVTMRPVLIRAGLRHDPGLAGVQERPQLSLAVRGHRGFELARHQV